MGEAGSKNMADSVTSNSTNPSLEKKPPYYTQICSGDDSYNTVLLRGVNLAKLTIDHSFPEYTVIDKSTIENTKVYTQEIQRKNDIFVYLIIFLSILCCILIATNIILYKKSKRNIPYT